ncbi:hypothetical protein ES703_118534 [subsurface metagenome]
MNHGFIRVFQIIESLICANPYTSNRVFSKRKDVHAGISLGKIGQIEIVYLLLTGQIICLNTKPGSNPNYFIFIYQ